MMAALHQGYSELIAWIFEGRGFRLFWLVSIPPRVIVLLIGLISFVLAILLIKAVGTEFVPQTDNGLPNSPFGSLLVRAYNAGQIKLLRLRKQSDKCRGLRR